jgi:DNA-binding CsgD family transcriptional regulator
MLTAGFCLGACSWRLFFGDLLMKSIALAKAEAGGSAIKLLSRREREISLLVSTGATNKEIAKVLGLSIKTVKNALTGIFERTGTRSRTELAIYIIKSADPNTRLDR